MYWLIEDTELTYESVNVSSGALAAPQSQCIGHVALDWVDYLGDDSLANRDEQRM